MKSAFPELTTERFLLRRFTDQDLPMLFAGLSDREVVKYYGISFDSLEATKVQLRWFEKNEKKGTGVWWAVCNKNSGEFLGAIGLNSIKKEHKKAEMGFWLLKEQWRKGIMKEAIPTVCRFAFEVLDLHRIEAVVETENKQCIQLLDTHGFAYEGTMKNCELKNGWFISLSIFALFPQNRQN